MSETGGKTSSSLAITEKKPQRAGGCIGIFFQLFDWNRRFAKKKLFSKKLLPPVRSKRTSKKFGGDDKLPKLRLIADENSGGFPNLKKNGVNNSDSDQKNEMRSPSLVARLMGLESMPSVQRERPKKASLFSTASDRTDKFVNGRVEFDRKDANFDKGEGNNNDWRPQKLQKTGISERKPLTKFGAEALHFKNVLSRSRKQHQHHPKLGSPVKSPKSLSGKNASRLIGAATRILEPGMQRSRARCALTYSNTLNRSPKLENFPKETIHLPPEQFYNSNCYPSFATTTPKQQQSSCGDCGHMLEISDTRCNEEENQSNFASSVSHYVNHCGQGSERGMPRQFIFYQEPEEEIERTEIVNIKPCSEQASHRKPPRREGEVKWHMTSQEREHQKHGNPSISFKEMARMPKQTLPGRDRTPKKSKTRVSAVADTVCETKNVIGFSPSFSSHEQMRMPAKMDICKFQAERKIGIRRKDSTSSAQKKPTNVCRHYENPGFTSSSFSKNTRSDVTRLAYMGEQSRSGSSVKKDSNVGSIPFNTSVKHKARNCAEDAKRGLPNDSSSGNASEKSIVDVTNLTTSSPKRLPLSGDALSALLEQKLKELNSQDEYELVKGGTTPKKTTSMILQELISALTEGQPMHEDLAVQFSKKPGSDHHLQMSSIDTSFTFKAKPNSTTTLIRHDNNDKERLSPGSVLEASFSNESCPSSNFDDSWRNKLMHESSGVFNNELNTSGLDANLLDFETSLSMGSRLLNNVSEVLCNINLAEACLKGNKLTHVKEVLLHAELLLGGKEFSVSHFLLTEMETLMSIIWMSFRCTRAWNQLEGFVFDSIIEYLDSRYNQFLKCGFEAWSRMQLDVNGEMLIEETVQEIRRWEDFAGVVLDDLIEWDMSHGLGKWTDFEIEAFETGVEIHEDIVQSIMDEIVVDLWKC